MVDFNFLTKTFTSQRQILQQLFSIFILVGPVSEQIERIAQYAVGTMVVIKDQSGVFEFLNISAVNWIQIC